MICFLKPERSSIYIHVFAHLELTVPKHGSPVLFFTSTYKTQNYFSTKQTASPRSPYTREILKSHRGWSPQFFFILEKNDYKTLVSKNARHRLVRRHCTNLYWISSKKLTVSREDKEGSISKYYKNYVFLELVINNYWTLTYIFKTYLPTDEPLSCLSEHCPTIPNFILCFCFSWITTFGITCPI